MKKFFILLMAVVMLFSVFVFSGCKDAIKVDGENSYNITIYKSIYRQERDGKIILEDYKLNKSFQVPKSQGFELKYKVDKITDDGDVWEEKYLYEFAKGNGEEIRLDHKKLLVLPSSDCTIIMREREKKDINVFVNGREIASYLSGEDLEDYRYFFKDTYNEDFYLYGSLFGSALKNVKRDVKMELYTNSSFTGEPFATGLLFYYSHSDYHTGGISFDLIEDTDVYIKVI